MKYIFLFYLPGAGGNFFSRCLNLLAGSHCWLNSISQTMPDDRLSLLSYRPVMYLTESQRNWIDWETAIQHYSKFQILPPDSASMSIWQDHPRYDLLEKNIAGIDDQQLVIYIDASDNFEWCLLNAIYKNSFFELGWLATAERMRQDPDIFKVSLKNLVGSSETFLIELQRVCDYIGHTMSDQEQLAINTLYKEWKTTTLDPKNFAEFKRRIGFHL